jgi:hypothetical protein
MSVTSEQGRNPLMALEQEIATYKQLLPQLLADKGKYVVIHGDELIGTFNDFGDALRAGYERFLNEPFLVRQISEEEPILHTSRSLRPCRSSTESLLIPSMRPGG